MSELFEVPEATPVLVALRAGLFRVSDEADLQCQVAEALKRAGITYFRREHYLGSSKRDRIDFWFAMHGVGLELKVGQTEKGILRQLLRYAEHREVRELIIASTHHSALRLPHLILGKRLHSIHLQAWC